jgi:hypothetical protein
LARIKGQCGMFVPRSAAEALGTEGDEAIALSIDFADVGLRFLGMKQAPVLGHHHKDQAVDEAQRLVKPSGQV